MVQMICLNSVTRNIWLNISYSRIKKNWGYTTLLAPNDVTSIYWPIQWRIQDFPEGAPTPKSAIIFKFFFAENCMKMKEFGTLGRGVPGARFRSANAILSDCINKNHNNPPGSSLMM